MTDKTRSRLGWVLLIAGTSLAGWVYHWGQVQQAVLLRSIAALDATLVANNRQGARQAKVIVNAIGKAVCSGGYNNVRDVAVLNHSQQILLRTQTLIDTLRAMRQQLQTTRGGIALPKVVRQLDAYSDFIRDYAPASHYLTRQFPGAPDPGWLDRTYFSRMPPEATRAALTKLEAQVRRFERNALSNLAQRVGSCCLYFTKIGAVAVPASETVAAGGEYRARLFLAEAISLNRTELRFMANGQPMPRDSEGVFGQVAFAIPAASPGQPDTLRAQWHGTIRAQLCPTDTIFQVDVPYFIVKPAAQP